jgi:hypothetical protein
VKTQSTFYFIASNSKLNYIYHFINPSAFTLGCMHFVYNTANHTEAR